MTVGEIEFFLGYSNGFSMLFKRNHFGKRKEKVYEVKIDRILCSNDGCKIFKNHLMDGGTFELSYNNQRSSIL